MIPFLSFDYQDAIYREELVSAFKIFLDTKYYILGKELELFEKNYALLNQTSYAVGVANGFDALKISLIALGIGPGDEVIVPSNTYIATWLAVSSVGATIIPVEPCIKTFNIDPNNIKKQITPKTKLIMPVHLYGQACNMTEIQNIAKEYSCFIIEDNAQGHLSSWKNQFTGSFGQINATSFYPGKNFGALGDGGAITTNSEELFEFVKSYRNYGSHKKYYNVIKGENSRLDELQASFLNIKLPYLQTFTNERKKIAKRYTNNLSACKEVITPYIDENADHVFHLYVIMCEQRNDLQAYLQNQGIQTMIHCPLPPHLQKAYSELKFNVGSFPIAEKIAKSCLSLPIYPGLQDDIIDFISEKIIQYYRN